MKNRSARVSSVLVCSLGMLLVVMAQILASCQKEESARQNQAKSPQDPVVTAVVVPPEPPAPTSAPADGLVARFDAARVVKEGNAVKEWTDLSGHKNTVTMTDPAHRPTLVAGEVAGLPVVRFDGKKQQFLSNVKLLTTQAKGLTFVAVTRLQKCDRDVLAMVGTYYTGNPDFLALGTLEHTGQIWPQSRKGSATPSGGSLIGGDFKVVIADFDLVKGVCRMFLNGMPLRSGPCSTNVDLAQNFAVGSYCGVTGFLTGDMAELLVYDRVLTPEQLHDVNAYLNNKYKLDFTRYVTPLATTLPFAYYPSSNQLEAAADVIAFGAKHGDAAGKEVTVEVLPVGGNQPVATGKIAMDRIGRGQEIFDIPNLKDGKYNVRFTYKGVTKVSDRVFERIHFPFEKCDLGTEHKIYPPFEPVTVNDDQVNVVSRKLRANGFGLFDSIVSQGQEILAEPIRLEGTAGGKKIEWSLSKPTVKSEFVDLATVEAQADGGAVTVKTVTKIEEDGCARVEMELSAGTKSATIDSLWVEIPLKDEEVPLFHWAVSNELRNNYGGELPRGGKVVWDVTTQVGAPPTYKIESGPSDGVVWDSTQYKTWPNNQSLYTPTFIPYVWLGGEARGLAWFGDSTRGYEIDNASPVQEVVRDGKKVVLRVHLVQTPITLRTPRTIVFGLQPSPTKPLRADWRTQDIPGGWECVTPWGGYWCSSKYPDGHDFKIVDKIVEAALTRKVDTKYFQEKDKNREFKDKKVQGTQSWLETQLRFAGNAANWDPAYGSHIAPQATYFEEHFTDGSYPEVQVFQDEWREMEFSRFQQPMGGWGTYPESYRNFVAYFGNEYVKRGVGLYFDNSCPKFTFNYRSMPAFTQADGSVHPATSLFDTRAYYKRMYKIIQAQNEKKAYPYPINYYLHVTNTQVLPYTTWSTFLLDQEQCYRMDDKKQLLPWPPNYIRAVTLSRAAGSVPTSLNPLRNGLGNSPMWQTPAPELVLSNWGMHKVHEIYGAGFTPWSPGYEWTWNEFGYRTPDVTVYNYWDPKAPMKVENDKVKWVAQTRDGSTASGSPQSGRGIIVLQSYSPKATEAVIRWPGAVAMMDYHDRKPLAVDKEGNCTVKLAANYGTQMLMVWTDPATVPPAVDAKTLFIEDFEFGLRQEIRPVHFSFRIVPDSARKGNFVLRMLPDRNAQFLRPVEGKAPAAGPSEISFRMRVPAMPKDRSRNGLVGLTYGSDDKKLSFSFSVDLDTLDGETVWAITGPTMSQDGKPVALVAGAGDLTSAINAQGPRRKELGKPDTQWHRIAVRVEGKQHTIMLDDKVVYKGTATAEPVGGSFIVGGSWDQLPGKERVPYVEIDDVKVVSIAAK